MRVRCRSSAAVLNVVLIIFCLILSSCYGSFKGYDGPERPDNETASIVIRNEGDLEGDFGDPDIRTVDEPRILFVDKRKVGFLDSTTVRVLPGWHTFIVLNQYITDHHLNYALRRSTTHYVKRLWRIAFDVAAGSSYRIVEMPQGEAPKAYVFNASGGIEEIDVVTEVIFFPKDK